MINCDAVRELLADAGVEAVEVRPDIRSHLEGCPSCSRFLHKPRISHRVSASDPRRSRQASPEAWLAAEVGGRRHHGGRNVGCRHWHLFFDAPIYRPDRAGGSRAGRRPRGRLVQFFNFRRNHRDGNWCHPISRDCEARHSGLEPP
jgi:hypothetical protein